MLDFYFIDKFDNISTGCRKHQNTNSKMQLNYLKHIVNLSFATE